MKIMFFALTVAILIMPQFCYAESPDNKGADEEYMLLLRFALETTQTSLPAEAEQDKANETVQNKKIIITVIPDSSCLFPPIALRVCSQITCAQTLN